ncbi:MAG: 1-deoxy-D-xylulose-5-phosphate synthase [Bacteroidales bacterium]|nr:1-deoxy-D-xylulose-5-phosphate synthase [Bacteroidales bacterium]MCF8327230.1 1-deoxy-D-xylulose-5-phosphate synthase [Bacteroidales bacterium]
MAEVPGKLLKQINAPDDIKKLNENQLSQLAEEIRQYIIQVVSKNAGHLGASLGTVELTLAIHYVFNAPYDKIIWDVGHQAYGHKIITGRRDDFVTNRQYGGISGFPNMEESQYDAFGTGHSSTSISAALGMAVASKIKGEDKRQHIAVIGDGAMTAGEAFEALNNAGVTWSNVLVILNDNNISIDNSVGALKEYLLDITTSKTYNKLKDATWEVLGKFGKHGPTPRLMVQKMQKMLKSTLLDESNFMESLHFRYFGPIDGHDTPKLIKTMEDLKDIQGPKLLHVITTKGKGYQQAEDDKTRFHAPGQFDVKTGQTKPQPANQPSKYQTVFGETLLEMAKEDKNIVAVTPAMPTGSGLTTMMKELPGQVFDVGIAEQHAVTFSAGLATQGIIPYCAIYSTFLQRAYDQIIHDVALQNLPVIFAIDRGGLVGADGATHHGVFDLAYLNAIPNMIISSPMDELEFRNLLFTARIKNHGPFAIRYPRGKGTGIEWNLGPESIEIGTGRKLKEGKDIAFVSIGHIGNQIEKAAAQLEELNIDYAHYDIRFLKPFDKPLLHEIFQNHDKIVAIEEGTIIGGLGSTIRDFMNEHNYQATVVKMGIPDQFIGHGTPEQLYKAIGLDAEGIVHTAQKLIQNKKFFQRKASS